MMRSCKLGFLFCFYLSAPPSRHKLAKNFFSIFIILDTEEKATSSIYDRDIPDHPRTSKKRQYPLEIPQYAPNPCRIYMYYCHMWIHHPYDSV